MKRSASAHWSGTIKDGKGTISTESGALSAQPYGFNTRFEDEPGTNPEELIGAAHAACFAMALSNELGQFDLEAKSIDAKADITLENQDGAFVITKSDIHVDLDVSGDDGDIEKAIKNAEANCPVSNALDMDVAVKVTRA